MEQSPKVRQLKSGIAFTGRGMTLTFDFIEQYANELDLKGFDEYIDHWPDIIQRALESAILVFTKRDELPDGASLEEAIDTIKTLGLMEARAVVVDFLAIGYSKKHRTMGAAVMQTYKDGDRRWMLQETYQAGLFFFTWIEPVKTLMLKKRRLLSTDMDMVDGLRAVAAYEAQKMEAGAPAFNLANAGGRIQKTTILKNGTFQVQDMGPFFKKGKLRAV